MCHTHDRRDGQQLEAQAQRFSAVEKLRACAHATWLRREFGSGRLWHPPHPRDGTQLERASQSAREAAGDVPHKIECISRLSSPSLSIKKSDCQGPRYFGAFSNNPVGRIVLAHPKQRRTCCPAVSARLLPDSTSELFPAAECMAVSVIFTLLTLELGVGFHARVLVTSILR